MREGSDGDRGNCRRWREIVDGEGEIDGSRGKIVDGEGVGQVAKMRGDSVFSSVGSN